MSYETVSAITRGIPNIIKANGLEAKQVGFDSWGFQVDGETYVVSVTHKLSKEQTLSNGKVLRAYNLDFEADVYAGRRTRDEDPVYAAKLAADKERRKAAREKKYNAEIERVAAILRTADMALDVDQIAEKMETTPGHIQWLMNNYGRRVGIERIPARRIASRYTI